MSKKNKKIILIIGSIFLIIILIIVWAYFNSDKEVTNNVQEIIPGEEITDEQLRTTNVSLYFIDKNNYEIKKEIRKIDSKKLLENPCSELLKLWLNGAEDKNLITGCLENVKLNNVFIEKNCAIIDFSKEFVKREENNNIDETKIVYCIVNTLTELKEVNCVKILIDGKENVYLGKINLFENYYRIKE